LLKDWDLLLPHVEFAYTKALCKSTDVSLFKLMYGVEPLTPKDLALKDLGGKLSVEA